MELTEKRFMGQATNQAESFPVSLIDSLRLRKERLQKELAQVEEAIEKIQASPAVMEALKALSKLGNRIF